MANFGKSVPSDMCAKQMIQISLCNFTGCILNSKECKVSSCEQRKYLSDCMDGQVDLRGRWAHMSEGTFPQFAAQIVTIVLTVGINPLKTE